MKTKEFEGSVERVERDMVRIRLDDGEEAIIPRSLVPRRDGQALVVGARISISVRRAGPETTEEWQFQLLAVDRAPWEYSVRRGEGDGMRDELWPALTKATG